MKSDLMKIPSKKKRLEGGGRKAALPEMEEDVVAWIEGCRAKNFRVTRASVRRKAADLAQAQGKAKSIEDVNHNSYYQSIITVYHACVMQVLLILGPVVVG